MSLNSLSLDLSKIKQQKKVDYQQSININKTSVEKTDLTQLEKKELKINLKGLLDSIQSKIKDKALTVSNDKKEIELNYNGQNVKVNIQDLNETINKNRSFMSRFSESSTSTERVISKLASGKTTIGTDKVSIKEKKSFFSKIFSRSTKEIEIGKLSTTEEVTEISEKETIDPNKIEKKITETLTKIYQNPKIIIKDEQSIEKTISDIKNDLSKYDITDSSIHSKLEELEKNISLAKHFFETGELNTELSNQLESPLKEKIISYKSNLEFVKESAINLLSTSKDENKQNILKTITLFDQKVLKQDQKTHIFLTTIQPNFKALLHEKNYKKAMDFLPSLESKSTKWMAVYDTALKIHLSASENKSQSATQASIHLLETQYKNTEADGPVKKTLLKLYALEAKNHHIDTSKLLLGNSAEDCLENILININNSLPKADKNINAVLIGASTKQQKETSDKVIFKTKGAIQKYKKFILDGIQKTLSVKQSASAVFAKNFQYMIGSTASKDQLSSDQAIKKRSEVLKLIVSNQAQSTEQEALNPYGPLKNTFSSITPSKSLSMRAGYDKEKTTLNKVIKEMKSSKTEDEKLTFAKKEIESYLFEEQSSSGTNRAEKLSTYLNELIPQDHKAHQVLNNIIQSITKRHEGVGFNLNQIKQSAQRSDDYSTASKMDLESTKTILKNKLQLSSLSDANIQDISKLTRNTDLLKDMLAIYRESNPEKRTTLKEDFGKKYTKAGDTKSIGQKITSSASNTVTDTNRELKFFHFDEQFKDVMKHIKSTPPQTLDQFISNFRSLLNSSDANEMSQIDKALTSRHNLIQTAQRDIKAGEGQYSFRDGITQTLGFERVNLTHEQISSIKIARTLILGLTAENKKTDDPKTVFHHISSHLELTEQELNQLPQKTMSTTEKEIYLFLKKDENKAILSYIKSTTAELSQLNDTQNITDTFNAWTDIQTPTQEAEKLSDLAQEAQESSVTGASTELSQINQNSFKQFFEKTKQDTSITIDFTKSRFFNTKSTSSAVRVFTSNTVTKTNINVGTSKKNQVIINFNKSTNKYELTLQNVKEKSFTAILGGEFWEAGISMTTDKEKNVTYHLSEKEMLSVGSKLLSGSDVQTDSLSGSTGKAEGQKLGLYASIEVEIPKVINDSIFEIAELSTKVSSMKSNLSEFVSSLKQTLSGEENSNLQSSISELSSEISEINTSIQQILGTTNPNDPQELAELEKKITEASTALSNKIEQFTDSIPNQELKEKLSNLKLPIMSPITSDAIQEKINESEESSTYSFTTGINLEVSRKKATINSALTTTKISEGAGKFELTVLGQSLPVHYKVSSSTVTNKQNSIISKASEESYTYNKYSPLDSEVHKKLSTFHDLPLYSLPITVKKGLSDENKTILLTLNEDQKEEFIKKNTEILEISTSSSHKESEEESSMFDQISAKVGYVKTDTQSMTIDSKLILFKKDV